jgi:hypothetical protein
VSARLRDTPIRPPNTCYTYLVGLLHQFGALSNNGGYPVRNQRKSPRIPVASPRPICQLKLGSAVLPAMLLDESKGGFAVLVGESPGISANQRAQLCTNRGWFNCRIVHVKKVVPTQIITGPSGSEEDSAGEDGAARITPADIGRFPNGVQGPWLRLGIRRLRRIAPSTCPADALPIGVRRLNPLRWIGRILGKP